MIYENVVLTLLLLLGVFHTLMSLRKEKSCGKRAEATEEIAAEDERVKDRFNEGFENIMAFSVNGKNGFEED